jgi:hypothetical protein
MSKELTLWVDDLRNPCKLGMDEQNTVWVLDYFQALNMLEKNNEFTVIHLDNDLGEHSPEGKSVFSFIEYMLHENRLPQLKAVFIHSDNASAVRSMLSAKDVFKEKYDVHVEQKMISASQYQ